MAAATRFEVNEITNGWVHDGDDLVHQRTGAVLDGRDAAIDTAGEARRMRVWRQATFSRPAFRDQARQLNREDLLRWLLDHGGLAGPVPGAGDRPGGAPVSGHR
jgi:hypothetical protein